jgi:hypothetical protein
MRCGVGIGGSHDQLGVFDNGISQRRLDPNNARTIRYGDNQNGRHEVRGTRSTGFWMGARLHAAANDVI